MPHIKHKACFMRCHMTCRATPISPSQIKALAALKTRTTERSSQLIYILAFALLETSNFKRHFIWVEIPAPALLLPRLRRVDENLYTVLCYPSRIAQGVVWLLLCPGSPSPTALPIQSKPQPELTWSHLHIRSALESDWFQAEVLFYSLSVSGYSGGWVTVRESFALQYFSF